MHLRGGPRAAGLTALVAMMVLVAGCGSSSGSSTATAASSAAASAPVGSAAATAALINKVYGVPTDPNSIPPIVKEALGVAAAPISPSLMSKFMSCLGQTQCVTGYPNAKLTIGLPIDDSTNTINR